MNNLFLKQVLAERELSRQQYKELKELSQYCQEDAIAAGKQFLATPAGLLGSFTTGAITGWQHNDPNKTHRKRKALWRFARMWVQQALL